MLTTTAIPSAIPSPAPTTHKRLLPVCLLASVTVCLPLILSGCGKSEETAQQEAAAAIEAAAKAQGQDIKVQMDGDKTTIHTTDQDGKKITYEANESGASIKSEDGNLNISTGADSKIPDDYPADAPRYESMSIDMSMMQDNAFVVSGSSTDAADKILNTLQTQATDKGWQPQANYQQGGMRMVSFNKDNRNLSITLNTEGEKTTVSITVEK